MGFKRRIQIREARPPALPRKAMEAPSAGTDSYARCRTTISFHSCSPKVRGFEDTGGREAPHLVATETRDDAAIDVATRHAPQDVLGDRDELAEHGSQRDVAESTGVLEGVAPLVDSLPGGRPA